jgi:hypothetical protein
MNTENKNTEAIAGDVLLDRGIKIRIPAPFFLRIFFIKYMYLIVKRPVLGQLIRISRVFAGMNVNIDETTDHKILDLHNLISVHGKSICKVISTACFRGRVTSLIFGGLLAKRLLWSVDADYLAKMTQLIYTLSGVDSFSNTIGLMSKMRITAPTNLSQKNQGSQKAE